MRWISLATLVNFGALTWFALLHVCVLCASGAVPGATRGCMCFRRWSGWR
jgi:hypothetical protein